MTLDQVEAMGDDLFSQGDAENVQISEDLFDKIKSLNCDEKKIPEAVYQYKIFNGTLRLLKNIFKNH